MSETSSPKGGSKPDAAVPERVAAAGVSPENAPAGLDWQAFSAAYFPGCRRHDLKAIVAYGAYRRSRGADEQPLSEAAPSAADATSAEAQGVGAWEDEGGASREQA